MICGVTRVTVSSQSAQLPPVDVACRYFPAGNSSALTCIDAATISPHSAVIIFLMACPFKSFVGCRVCSFREESCIDCTRVIWRPPNASLGDMPGEMNIARQPRLIEKRARMVNANEIELLFRIGLYRVRSVLYRRRKKTRMFFQKRVPSPPVSIYFRSNRGANHGLFPMQQEGADPPAD